MKEYYRKDVGKITYVYGVDLEEHKKVIEKQQKRIAKLEKELAELKEKAIVPKFKRNDFVYAIFTKTQIYKGQIDAFDYYTNSYLVFPNEDVGNEWIKADKVFKSKAEAQAKLKELKGNE